jgi:hypothetical protein
MALKKTAPNPRLASRNKSKRGVSTGRKGYTGGKSRQHYIVKEKDKDGKRVDRSDAIILLPGEYPVYHQNNEFIEEPEDRPIDHWHGSMMHSGMKVGKKFLSAQCSAGYDPQRPKDCVFCKKVEDGVDYIKPPREHFYITIFHLAPYIKTLITDDAGKPKTNQKGDFSYWWQQIPWDPDEATKALKESKRFFGDKYRRFGLQKYLCLPPTQYDVLVNKGPDLQKHCASCHEGQLTPLAIACEHRGCGMYTPYKNPNELLRVYDGMDACPNCDGDLDGIRIDYDCDCCNDPDPTNIYDCVLWIRRDGEGAKTNINVLRHRSIVRFKIPEEYGPATVEELLEEVKPFDFPAMTKPDSLRDQAKYIGVDNPYAGDGGTDYDKDGGERYGKDD